MRKPNLSGYILEIQNILIHLKAGQSKLQDRKGWPLSDIQMCLMTLKQRSYDWNLIRRIWRKIYFSLHAPELDLYN